VLDIVAEVKDSGFAFVVVGYRGFGKVRELFWGNWCEDGLFGALPCYNCKINLIFQKKLNIITITTYSVNHI
jgi:hypothetical protein